MGLERDPSRDEEDDVDAVFLDPLNEPIIVEVIEEDDSEFEDLADSPVITFNNVDFTADMIWNQLVQEVASANDSVSFIFSTTIQNAADVQNVSSIPSIQNLINIPTVQNMINAPNVQNMTNVQNEQVDDSEPGGSYQDDSDDETDAQLMEHMFPEQAPLSQIACDSGHEEIVSSNRLTVSEEEANNASSSSALGRRASKCGYHRNTSYKGKKQLRRKRNNDYLNRLKEETDDESTDYDSKFHTGMSSIFHNQQSYEIWSTFSQLPESAQYTILDGYSRRPVASGIEYSSSNPSTSSTLTNHEAFLNLSPSQRDFISQYNFPLGILQYFEHTLVLHFTKNPNELYISEEINSFERLILHSLAAYYSLDSESVNVSNTHRRITKINNARGAFHVPVTTLTQYLENLRDPVN